MQEMLLGRVLEVSEGDANSLADNAVMLKRGQYKMYGYPCVGGAFSGDDMTVTLQPSGGLLVQDISKLPVIGAKSAGKDVAITLKWSKTSTDTAACTRLLQVLAFQDSDEEGLHFGECH